MWGRHNDPFRGSLGRAAARRAKPQRDAPIPFYDFVVEAWPILVPNEPWQGNWYHRELCAWCEALIDGRAPKQVHCGPSRSGKSTILSDMLQPWTWTFAPWMQFLTAGHSWDLATTSAARSRRVVESDWYQTRWPLRLRHDQNTKDFFVNVEGGHRQVASNHGATTGKGGHVVIGDDLLDAEDRYSPAAVRRSVGYWRTGLCGRLNDPRNPKLLLTGQRLALNDPPGEVMKLGTYTHLVRSQVFDSGILAKVPRGAPAPVPSMDPRSEDGELMWPERYDEAGVESLKHDLGPAMWAAAQQQWPTTEDGGIIAESHLREWELPGGVHEPDPGAVLRWLVPDAVQLHLDGRFKAAADSGSYVVIMAVARKGHKMYVLDMFRQRVGVPDTIAALLRMIETWRPVLTVLEAKASGQFILDEFQAKIPGLIGYSPTDSKRARLEGKAGHFRGGNVYLPTERTYDWAAQVKAELVASPYAANDDIPDMIVQGLTHLFPLGQSASFADLLANI